MAATVRPSLNVTWIWLAPAITCALVRILPVVSRTMPEPIPSPVRPRRASSVVMVTTPGAAFWDSAAADSGVAATALAADDNIVLEAAEGVDVAGRRLITASAPSAPPARPPTRTRTATSKVRDPGRPPPGEPDARARDESPFAPAM